MRYDLDKVDEITMALLSLVIHTETEYGALAWKGFDWDTLNRIYEKILIGNPAGKSKSIHMSAQSVEYARRMFEKHFGINHPKDGQQH